MHSPNAEAIHPRAGFVVGAYAASPAHQRWDAVLEGAFYDGLSRMPDIGALELPWTGVMHPHSVEWLHAHFPQQWSAVVTSIPHTMGAVNSDPHFGLASASRDGRRAALTELRRLREAVLRFNDVQSRKVVGVVELHSAPRGPHADREALVASLAEASEWEWDGAELVIEHVDAWSTQHPVEKGFLSLEAELLALRSLSGQVGMFINWARSVIETRRPTAAAEQIQQVRGEGLLRGFIASGVSAEETSFGYPWIDAHLPFATDDYPQSLLSEVRLNDAVAAAGNVAWLGVKVGVAGRDASVAQRLTCIRASLDMLAEAAEVRPRI